MSELNNLKNFISELDKDISSLKGKCSLLSEQIKDSKTQLDTNKIEKEKHQKAVEVLNFIQSQTQDKIKESFEEITTYALKYIYSSDYKFELEFDRRGNLGTMEFNIKTPDFTESANICDTSGGGIIDIVALALRMVLLEVSYPKIEGPIILDESLKHLSKEYREKASNFLNEINKKLNRQIIMITHAEEFKDSKYNLLEIK